MKMLALLVGILGCGWGLAPTLLIPFAWLGYCWWGAVGLDSTCEGTTLMFHVVLDFGGMLLSSIPVCFLTPQRSRQFKYGAPFWDYGLGCLWPYYGPKVLRRKVKTGPIVTHLKPACTQTKAPLLKLWSHAHGRWNCYKRVIVGKYNLTTIKEIYLLLDKIRKGFSIKIKKKSSTTTRNIL